MSRRLSLALLALALLLAGIWYWTQRRSVTRQIFAMDTFMELTACGPHAAAALEEAVQEILRLDALLSTGRPDSEVSRLNREGGGPVSGDTAALLTASLSVWQSTGGLFDVTIYPLMDLWGFPSQDYYVPTEAELSTVLPLVDAGAMDFDGSTLSLSPGQQIDFGGIAKGYAADRCMEIFRAHGVKSALVSLGGNVQVLGSKPNGSPWRVAVQDPEGGYLLAVPVRDMAVVTSGGYQRFFEEDGQTYIHILDPRTGCPAASDLTSVTIFSPDGIMADALSTSLFIMGLEDAVAYWRSAGERFDMVLVTEDGTVYATGGLDLAANSGAVLVS